MAPKVSVVTCSYNRPDLLRQAVLSLRTQTDSDWEHLIFDDRSSDPAVRSVLEWAARDPRVRVWLGDRNVDQPSRLWNFMMDRARGRYLTVLDDDNEKLPTFVERMSRVLDEEPGVDVVTCGWKIVRDSGEPSGDYFLNLSTRPERLKKESTCDGGAMLYRRSAFERAGYFSEILRTNEDWDWLRRAAHNGSVKNLHESHCTYRPHAGSRMTRAAALGNDMDVLRVRGRTLSSTFGVLWHFPSTKLTASQEDVCGSLRRAIGAIPWLTTGRDLGVFVAPFQILAGDVAALSRGLPKVLSLHMEDPYALSANLDRVRAAAANCGEVWVATNDAAAAPHYRRVVGDRVIVYPSLSADDVLAGELLPPAARDVDVLFCGYAYPSRKAFVSQLLPLLDDLRVRIIGDGWEGLGGRNVEIASTLPLAQTCVEHARARAVVCLHRTRGDCADGPVQPATINRGYMEGYSGARVFLDRQRPLHGLDAGDVVWYDRPMDLAISLRKYLSLGDDSAAKAFAEKCRTLYTYRARLARVLNCVRSPRFLAEIP